MQAAEASSSSARGASKQTIKESRGHRENSCALASRGSWEGHRPVGAPARSMRATLQALRAPLLTRLMPRAFTLCDRAPTCVCRTFLARCRPNLRPLR